MKKALKKAISILLVAVMIFGAAPLAGFVGIELPEFNFFGTKAEAATDGYYTYTVSGGEATITRVDSSISGDVVIPSTLGGYPVTSIGGWAFEICTGLKSITIPDSVISIGDSAFLYCTSLESITIPDSVTSIDDYAFENCSSLKSITIPDSVTSMGGGVFEDCEGLTSITFPDNITSINSSMFRSCGSLKSITIPDSVTSIGSQAFEYCFSLESITIPDSVTSIGYDAFCYCYNLKSVTIPDSVTSIGESVFLSCTSLTSITVDSSNTAYSSDEYGVLFNKNKTVLIQYPVGNIRTSYVIPDSVTSIGFSAFLYCISLASVTISDSVTRIDSYAFSDCDRLTDVYYEGTEDEWNAISIGNYNEPLLNANIHFLPKEITGACGDNLTYALNLETGELIISGTGAMYNWSSSSKVPWYSYSSSIKTVEIGDGVTSIGDYAFCNCDILENVSLPVGLTSIGDCAFLDCKSLAEITIPKSVTSIGKSSFESTAVPEIIIPEGVTSIGYRAFYNCADLKNVAIPDAVTLIGDNAFYDCVALETVSIGNGIETIGYNAFFDCVNITDVHYNDIKAEWNKIFIEEGNETLLNANFHFQPTVVSGNCGDSIEWTLNRETGELVISGEGELPDRPNPWLISWHTYMDSIKTVVISEGITYIGDALFNGCRNLEGIEIPASIKAIGSDAFLACYNLKNVTFGENSQLESIGYGAFHGCLKLDIISIPAGVKSIGEHAFDTFDGMTDVYYDGTKDEWKQISIGDYNQDLLNADIHFAYYYLTYIADDHTSVVKVKVGEPLPDPKINPKEGHTFAGWDKSIPDVMPAEDLTFTAIYEVNTYNVKWNIDGEVIQVGFEYGSEVVGPAEPEKDGYKFIGWTPEVPDTMPAYDLCFTAVFERAYICPDCGKEILGEEAVNEHIATEEKSKIKATIKIKNNTGSKTVNYGETLKLTAIVTNKPVNAKICWYVDGMKKGEGDVFNVSFESGTRIITVKLVDINGVVYQDANGNEISDSENVTVKAGFFQKIISFFKNLFGMNRTVVQAIFKGIY